MTTRVYMGTLVETSCWCGIHLAVPQELYIQARDNRKANGDRYWIYCPLGHSFVFSRTDLEEARRQIANLEEDRNRYRAWYRDEQARLERTKQSLSATRGVLTRTNKRIAAGVCPCCHRSFQNLARHMSGQHPEFPTKGD